MLSVLRNSGEQLQHTFYIDGIAADADGAVTIGITKADGTALVAPGTATTHGTTGQYKYVLAPQASLNLLTVTWTGTFGGVQMSQVDQIDIVGGVYCSIGELLAMSNLSTVTADTLAQKRREFEDLAERYCGVAFVPRYARDTLAGTGTTSVLLTHTLPRSILSASSTDTSGTTTAFTITNWQRADSGMLITDGDTLTQSVYGERNIVVEYEHGYDSPPSQIVSACKLWVRNKVLADRNSAGRDILREVNDQGFQIQYSTPDWNAGRPTGMFEVDAALNSVGRAAPAVA